MITADRPIVLCGCGNCINDITSKHDATYRGICLACGKKYVAPMRVPNLWQDHSRDWIKA